jgi:RNA polymerase sigma-70 factor (ECF subfamily)
MPNPPAEEGNPGRPGEQPEQKTSLSLLERARSCDAEAWRQIVQLYRPLVHFWCGRASLGTEDGEDVAQEVFAAAAAGLGDFRRDRPGDTFRGWLHGITRNKLLMHHRRHQGQPRAEGGSEALRQMQEVFAPLTGTEPEEAAEISALYRRALEYVRREFEGRTWQAFWLTVIEDRAPATLTAELGLSAAGIRQAKSRVLRRLKQELGELIQ